MALIHADFVEETTTTTGTGSLTLAGATTGNHTFSTKIGNGNTCIYGIAASDGKFESGVGTVSAGVLARTTLLSSSTDSVLDLPAGTHTVYCTFAAEGGAKAYLPSGASELSELSDVAAAVSSPSDGDILVYRSTGSAFKLEEKPAAGSNPAAADITDATADGIALITSADANPFTDANATTLGSATQPGDLATVATTGAYSDLSSQPTLVTALPGLSDVDATVSSPSDGDILVYRSTGSAFKLEEKPAAGSNPAAADITDATADGIALITSADANPFTDANATTLGSATQPGDLATVATTGAYSDVSGTPTIPTASDATPQDLGTAAAGVGSTFSRADHVHNAPAGAGDVSATGTPLTTEFARWTDATTVEGRTPTEVISDLGIDADITTLTLAASSTVSGSNTGDQTITLTGDVTGTGPGSFAATVEAGVITLAKMDDLAQDQFIGRTTASTGVPETTTVTAAARTVLDDTTVGGMVDTLGGASSTGSGGLVRATSPALVTPALGTPSSGVLSGCSAYEASALASTGEAGGTKFLREDGDGTCSFQTVLGSGDVVTVGTPANNELAVWTGAGTLKGEPSILYDGTALLLTDKILQRPTIKDYGETYSNDTDSGATHTCDLANGNVQGLTLTANCTLTFSNPPGTGIGGSMTLILRQDGTGSRTVTWPASVVWPGGTAPTLTTTASAVDVFTFITVDAGTIWLGFTSGQDFS